MDESPVDGFPVTGSSTVEEPAVAPAPVSREEAIAEVLRAALAEGHSDDALAGILRRVVAGDAPQTATVEPAAVVEPAPAAPVTEPPVDESPAPVVAEVAAPAVEVTPPSAVEVAAPVVTERSTLTDLFGPLPSAAAPVPAVPAAAPSVSTGLWGEVIAAPAPPRPTRRPTGRGRGPRWATPARGPPRRASARSHP